MLFQHGGELSEFAGLLSELAVRVEECSGALPNPDELQGAQLVVITGKRLLESGAPNLSLWPRTIAVIDDSSRTLVSQLSRVGAAMVIRRPIHPRALRLLLLHEIYRGPERRSRQRILIGHPIRLSSGLFRPHATLLELSPSGARIELANPPKVGAKIRILIGKDLTKGKPVKLQARVVRSIRSKEGSRRTESEIGVAILDANRHAKVIKGILDRFALGPAPWTSKTKVDEPGVATTTAAPSAAVASTASDPAARSLPPSHASAPLLSTPTISDTDVSSESITLSDPVARIEEAPDTTPAAAPIPEAPIGLETPESLKARIDETDEPRSEEGESFDRRQETRIPYERRVVALGEEAARVLVGRDLSRGGMRIAATPSIAVGDVLRVALHSGTQTEPTIIIARAQRDDGDAGLVLSFDDLSVTQSEQLEKIIASGLPVHASADDLEDPNSVTNDSIVVAEMIETISSHKSVESEAQIDAHLDSVFDTSESI